MKEYSHIFFDLDHTIWDFETNARDTLEEIFEHFGLEERGVPGSEQFVATYTSVNDAMWTQYRNGEISKWVLRSQRYNHVLKHFGVEDEHLAEAIGTYYIAHSPRKTALFPNAHETLGYLQEKYELHIITNGFEEVQHVKLKHSRLVDYFGEVITSEAAGSKKPMPQIFQHALKRADASADECLMVGDDLEVDVLASMAQGMDGVFFNPNGLEHEEDITHEITDLEELQDLL